MKKVIATLAVVAALVTGCTSSTKTVGPPEPAASGSVSLAEPTESATATDAPSADSTTAPTDLPLGTLIRVRGTTADDNGNEYDYAFEVTPSAKIKSSKGPVSEFGSAPTHGRFVGIQVTYLVTLGKYAPNFYGWTLRNSNGDVTQTGAEYLPMLSSGTVRHGQRARGWLTYDVPPGTYSLEFVTNIGDDEPASWKLTVK